MASYRTVKFTVESEPIPKARPRVTRYGTYTPQNTKLFENLVRQAYTFSRSHDTDDHSMLTGALRVHITAIRSTFHAADWDNLGKAVTDALNKLAYEDDNQIVDGHVIKKVDKSSPRVIIEISEVDGREYGYPDNFAPKPKKSKRRGHAW